MKIISQNRWKSWTYFYFLISISVTLVEEISGFNVIDYEKREENVEEKHTRIRRAIVDSSMIPSNYSIYELPPTQGGPVQVKISVIIMNVRDIKEISEEVSIEMNLRMFWKDARLANIVADLTNSPSESKEEEYVLLQPSLLSLIWHPDVFIDHLKTIGQPAIISRPASLRMYPDNTLRYSARMTINIACPMDFHYYPADTQRCNCDFLSYAYSDKKMLLSWTDKITAGAIFAYELDLSNYFVGLDNPNNFIIETSSGSYSGLRYTILLTRKLSYHVIQTYIPSIVLVIVSWLSFLVNSDSVPGRMTVLMTCLLTLISMFASVRQSTPNVSYVKSVDVWMVVCVVCVILALMEFTLVLKIKTMKFAKKDESTKTPSPLDQSIGINHLNSLRGSRGNVAQVYYPNPLPVRRLSNPNTRTGFGLPIEEEDSEVSEYPSSHRSSADYGITDYQIARRSSLGLPPSEPSALYSRTLPLPAQMKSQTHHPLPISPVPAVSSSKNEKIVAKVELIASIIIPIIFIVFNFLYWPWLIVSSEYYNQESVTGIF